MHENYTNLAVPKKSGASREGGAQGAELATTLELRNTVSSYLDILTAIIWKQKC